MPSNEQPSPARLPVWAIATACIVIVAAIAGVISLWTLVGGVTKPARTAAPAGVVSVVMRNVQFEPVTVTVERGGEVEWLNDNLVPHTATAATFDSGSLSPGQSWRHRFDQTGTFPYACAFHPHMKGTIVVR